LRTVYVDTYLNHAVPGTPDLNTMKNHVGVAMALIRENNFSKWQSVFRDPDAEPVDPDADADGQMARLIEACNLLPGMDNLNLLALTTSPDVFFEVLCSNIRNELLAYQGWLNKIDNAHLNF
jgi:hypothetical protein